MESRASASIDLVSLLLEHAAGQKLETSEILAAAGLDAAFLLGYAEQSAFNHAFKRWTGATPRDYRKGNG